MFKDETLEMDVFERDPANLKRTIEKQKNYTIDASKVVEYDLKNTLTKLVQFVFGNGKLMDREKKCLYLF